MLILALLLAASQPNEVYFEQTTVTYADSQATGPLLLSRVWFAGRKMRLEAGPTAPALILRLDQGKAYRISPRDRRAMALPLDDLREGSRTGLSAAGDVMGSGSARTQPIEGTKVIAGRTCRGFRIRSGAATIDIYVASDVPVSMEAFSEFLEWSGANQSLGSLLGEIRKLPGFPMETRARVKLLGHVQETLSTVTLVDLRPIRATLFEPPPDYELTSERED